MIKEKDILVIEKRVKWNLERKKDLDKFEIASVYCNDKCDEIVVVWMCYENMDNG